MHSANDDHFDFRQQLLTLGEGEAIEYAMRYFDQNCDARDAEYLSEILTAGDKSVEVTYRHALAGSPVAQLVYGTNTMNGTHTAQSVSEGLFWLRRSCNNGNAKAALVLAGVYLQGDHIARDPARAFEYATRSAQGGLPAGEYVLANLLLEGEGNRAPDQERAIVLLQSAARSGYAPAIEMLADNGIAPASPG